MKALLISNGNIKDINLIKNLMEDVSFLLAADGGANYCVEAGVIPDLIIGDLDSIRPEVLESLEGNNVELLRYPSKKNATDTEICLDYLIDKGYKEIVLLGSIGSRLDHSVANIFLLEYLHNKNVSGTIVNDKNKIYLVEGRKKFTKGRKYISVLAISDDGIVVSLNGLEYPLDHKHIKRGSTLGISNEFKDRECIVDIHSGRALVIESED